MSRQVKMLTVLKRVPRTVQIEGPEVVVSEAADVGGRFSESDVAVSLSEFCAGNYSLSFKLH